MARNQTEGRVEPDYRTRRYRPDDVEGVLELDRAVWGRERDPEWFRWKYEQNPYLEEPPVFVAERDGDIVGARPFIAFRLRAGAGGETRLALQPADTMVHPDHRRRGVFTAMNQRALATYRSRAPGVYFNFPNEQSRPGYENLGWRVVRPQVTYYRVDRPSAFLGDFPGARLLGHAAGPPVRGYSRAKRVVSTNGRAPPVDVHRVHGTPIDRLVSIYRRRIPDSLHAERTAEFFEWRFASPVWSRRTYVATCGGEDVAALVSRTRELADGTTVTHVADVLPLDGEKAWWKAVEELLGAVVDDHGSDLFSVASTTIPHELLTAHGFLPDDRLPLSRLTSWDASLVVRPFDFDTPEPWGWNGRRLDRSENWRLSFVEWDTA